MMRFHFLLFLSFTLFLNAQYMSRNKLTSEEKRIIIDKGTEMPFTGALDNHYEKGLYVCRQCNTPLYDSSSKFKSGCGWPSFDDELPKAVTRLPDPDGRRTEIVCTACKGHLGHVFVGEQLTDKNTRHCVNSKSLQFVPHRAKNEQHQAKAYFAGGCFWGVEYYFQKLDGVLAVHSGYMGGNTQSPTYKEVCYADTGHVETVEVVYDTRKLDFKKLCRYFFEIHDATQLNRQGPDVGAQYASVVFYRDQGELETTKALIKILTDKGYDIKTQLKVAVPFWKAEGYHQDYYSRKGGVPYCHSYRKLF